MTEIAQIISNYGIMTFIVILFFWQYVEQRRSNKEREEKLYKVIETLSERIPGIEASLTRIERSIENGRH